MNSECAKIIEAHRLTVVATIGRNIPWRIYCVWLDLYLEKEFR